MEYSRSIFVKTLADHLKGLQLPVEKKTDTVALNKMVASVANEYGLSTWALGLNKYEDAGRDDAHISGHEWLYDLVCYRYDNEHYALNDTILVVESEWKGKRYASMGNDGNDTYGEVKYDFQKLLLSNADVKLLVYKNHNRKDGATESLKQYFQRRIDNYRQGRASDFFLFACYSHKKTGKRYCSVCSYSRKQGWKEL